MEARKRVNVWKAEAGICWKGQGLMGLTGAALKAHQKKIRWGKAFFKLLIGGWSCPGSGTENSLEETGTFSLPLCPYKECVCAPSMGLPGA